MSVAMLGITNETTSIRDRINAIFSVSNHWTEVLMPGQEPSQLASVSLFCSLLVLVPVRQIAIGFILLRAAATPSKQPEDSAKK